MKTTNNKQESEEVRGISVFVYRNSIGGDCTNYGLSSKKDRLIMVGEDGSDFDCPHTTKEGEDYLVYVLAFPGNPILEHYRAIPKSLLDSGKHVMFGGNFVYSSDSRFPSDSPVKVFDRVE